MKQCYSCKELKELSNFRLRRSGKYTYHASYCRRCKAKQDRVSQLKSKYNLSPLQLEAMLKKQYDRCDICLRHSSEFHNGLHIDHCHSTNKVRGLLCRECNLAIGLLKDDVDLAERLISYLIRTK